MSDYTIIGAGAIGAILGAALIEAGHDVRFIEQNADHVAAVREKGLRLSGYRDTTVRPIIATPDDVDWPLQRVLLAVKARHTIDALAPFAARIESDGFIVSLQNGLEEYRISDLVGAKRTIGAFLTFGGFYQAPGEIAFGGLGTFKIGEIDGALTPRISDLQRDFSALQPVEITDNIFGFLWSKIALGAIYFATAVADADVTDLYANERYRALFGRLAGEVVSVADARGARMEIFDGFDPAVFRPNAAPDMTAIEATWDGQNRYWNRHDNKRTGIWRDLAIHKRKTEADRLIGAVLEIAGECGVATPGLTRLVAIIGEIEDGKRALGPQNLDAVAAV